ncbi:MAG TPA: hypothetical protein VM901_09445 [Bdellovibrionota bacterium]|jgi:hypothetical protein|nr:hypothetical protein [Bdellovibrionota bacterium]
MLACSTRSNSSTADTAIVSEGPYAETFESWSPEQKKSRTRSIENFFEAIRPERLAARTTAFENEHPTLMQLRSGETSTWFGALFETLVGTQLMAQSNSFRSYKNVHCLDAFVRPLASVPLPPASELMSLDEFMKAGPRIPDENTYVQQVRLFCGRRAINALQGLENAQVTKIYLSLKNNLVLQRAVLSRASDEATQILNTYRAALSNDL